MAIEKEISFKVNGAQDLASIENAIGKSKETTTALKRELLELEKQLKQTPETAVKAQGDLKKAIDRTKTSIKEEAQSVAELNEIRNDSLAVQSQNIELMDQLDSATGGYLQKIPMLKNGLGSLISGFNGLKLAIAGTGIGLLILALASLISYFKSSEEGQDKLARGMAVLGAIGNTITNILSKLGEMLVWAFENPKEAIMSLFTMIKERIWNTLVGIFEFLPQMGKAFMHLVKGEFSQAGTVATNALGKIVAGQENIVGKFKEMGNASKEFFKQMQADAMEAIRIAKLMEDLTVRNRDLIVETARSNKKVAELRAKASQKDVLSLKQQEALLSQAWDVEKKIYNERAKLAQDEFTILQAKSKARKRDTTEELDELAQAEAKVIQSLADRASAERSASNEIQSIRKEEASRVRAINAEKSKLQKEADTLILEERKKNLEELLNLQLSFEKTIEDTLAKSDQEKLDLEKSRALKSLEQVKLSETEKQNALDELNTLFQLKQSELDEKLAIEKEEKRIEKEFLELENISLFGDEKIKKLDEIEMLILENATITDEARTKLEERTAKARTRIAQEEAKNRLSLYGAIGTGAEALSGILGKQTALGKTLAVGASLINTYSAITGQLSAFSTVPIPGYAIANAIATGAVGFASVLDIVKTKIPNESGGGVSIPSMSSGGSAPTPPTLNIVGNTSSNQINETLNDLNNRPIKTYVVGKDVDTQNELERNAVNSSSI